MHFSLDSSYTLSYIETHILLKKKKKKKTFKATRAVPPWHFYSPSPIRYGFNKKKPLTTLNETSNK